MDLKKLCKALLFPPFALTLVLTPIALALLIYAMAVLGTDAPLSIAAYVLAAYTLTLWCCRIPDSIRFFRAFREENPLMRKWRSDARLRVNVSLYGALGFNDLYGLFQLWLGVYHKTFWFSSLGVYYLCLALMRFFLVRHTRRYVAGARREAELRKYRACGWVFLVMNLALSLIVFFMVYWNRTFVHHMITAIAMAAYTFFAFSAAIVNVIKYKKYNSPVFSASKIISLAAASVSMLTLTSTMLTTFSDGSMDALTQKILLGLVGFAVSAAITAMAVYMIVGATKQLKGNEQYGK